MVEPVQARVLRVEIRYRRRDVTGGEVACEVRGDRGLADPAFRVDHQSRVEAHPGPPSINRIRVGVDDRTGARTERRRPSHPTRASGLTARSSRVDSAAARSDRGYRAGCLE